MTPEQLKKGRELADEITRTSDRLKMLELWREKQLSKSILFKLNQDSMEILTRSQDSDLVDTVLTMAVSRITTRLESLKKEFEAL